MPIENEPPCRRCSDEFCRSTEERRLPNEEPPSSRRYELSSPLRLLSPLRRSGSDGDCERPERIDPSVGELPASSRSDASARLGLPLPAVEWDNLEDTESRREYLEARLREAREARASR